MLVYQSVPPLKFNIDTQNDAIFKRGSIAMLVYWRVQEKTNPPSSSD